MSKMVETGWLGVTTIEVDKVSQSFSSLMNQVKATLEIPEYQHDVEFKGQFKGGPAKYLIEAKALIDQAQRDRTLTPVQIMIARIYVILDDAPEEDQRRQAELLKELFSTQPVSFIHMLGNDRFYADHRYRPAIACLNHYLKFGPDDVSSRLNVGFAYDELGMYDEADKATDYVFEHELGISDFGRFVAFLNKAKAALGRKEYENSIQLGERSFAFNPGGGTFPLLLVLLAAAQTGNMPRFKATAQQFQQAFPSKYLEWRLQIDAAEAYALVKNNQRDAARKLVEKWRDSDRPEGRVRATWRQFPDGMDVARNFSELMKS
jgi:tetratricopeptide (TPR) repeat protein